MIYSCKQFVKYMFWCKSEWENENILGLQYDLLVHYITENLFSLYLVCPRLPDHLTHVEKIGELGDEATLYVLLLCLQYW